MNYKPGSFVSQRQAFGEALCELAGEFPELLVLDPDVAPSTQTHLFAAQFPDRFIETGIAEQNMAGIAAGLAEQGYIPFISAFAVFMVHRAGDQIRNVIAHTNANVKINGSYAGLPSGRAGATHSCFEDIAIMRALPNMTVIDPADAVETALFTRMALQTPGPVYLRTVRCEVETIFDGHHKPQFGKAITLKNGSDISIISSGMMTARALFAAEILQKQGTNAAVIHMPFIKPLDEEAVIQAARGGIIFTVENHSIIGGLGSAVCETVCDCLPCKVFRLGFPDVFLESGDDEAIFARYGLTAQTIATTITKRLQDKDGNTKTIY